MVACLFQMKEKLNTVVFTLHWFLQKLFFMLKYIKVYYDSDNCMCVLPIGFHVMFLALRMAYIQYIRAAQEQTCSIGP